jgi:glycosyltransferase involved in cell wall biosynthesis
VKIAVIHDWLVVSAGAERVLQQILTLFPEADLFSLVDFLPTNERHIILNKKPRKSFIQWLPFAARKYRSYLPIMPVAVECLDLSSYDLILSSSHAIVKGVRKRQGQLHICYCHTPMRYAWDLREQYLHDSGLASGIKGFLARIMLKRLAAWDLKTAIRTDHFIANSRYVAERIQRIYSRTATVVYPPVDVNFFSLHERKENFYIAISRMVPYKKMDLIVEAFAAMPERRLVVIGTGPDFEKVRAKGGKNVTLLGYQDTSAVKSYLQRGRAFVFAAEEDFGIVPVEAQACSTPVIAYRAGGALETVIENTTGIFLIARNVPPYARL